MKNVMAINLGGTHVTILATGKTTHRECSSGPTLPARRMVSAVKKLAGIGSMTGIDWLSGPRGPWATGVGIEQPGAGLGRI